MLFNSAEFLFLFLPACLAGYLALGRFGKPELALTWLTLFSLAFYSWWNPANLPVLAASLAINFAIARCIAAQSGRTCLVLGLIANLALLGLYKYADFAIRNLNALAGLSIPLPGLTLPLAISFYTFQQIGFLLDIYRRRIAVPSLRDHALFVTFFPQLIAGPIVHFREMMPQLRRQAARATDCDRMCAGLTLLLIGLFKKIVVADSLAPWANDGFASATAGAPIDPIDAWIAALAYTFQIYFDFSGYCDMAVGLGNLFGIRLPVNFYSPYRARSIIEFWRRWHMTLSRFLRDYVYIPLGGSKNGRRWRNLLLTMMLGGLWHGANWTFVAWGALHGFYLIVNHAWRHVTGTPTRPSSAMGLAACVASWLLTFVCVVVGWVIFRADSLEAAATMLGNMFLLPAYLGNEPDRSIQLWRGGLLLLLVLAIWLPNAMELTHGRRPGRGIPAVIQNKATNRVGARVPLLALRIFCYGALLLHAVCAGPKAPSEFLYFNF